MTAADGEDALSMMRVQPPDVLVTDLSLPGMDGFELIARVRADAALRSGFPIICLSGYGGHEHEQRALAAGCDRILQKPCMPDDSGRGRSRDDPARGQAEEQRVSATVFIVEDDVDTREMLGRFLELEGYTRRDRGEWQAGSRAARLGRGRVRDPAGSDDAGDGRLAVPAGAGPRCGARRTFR